MPTLSLRFYPESEGDRLLQSSGQYQAIWDSDGTRIVEALRAVSNLPFRVHQFNVLVYEGPSGAYPLRFRASSDHDKKRAAIVHELCHRLLGEHGLELSRRLPTAELENHTRIYIILLDAWIELWGDDFARRAIQWESSLQPTYQRAWNLVLSWSPEERRAKLQQVKQDRHTMVSAIDQTG